MKGLYKVYCLAHKAAKKLLKRYNGSNDYPLVSDCRVRLGVATEDCTLLWRRFIYNAAILSIESNAGSLYAGYIMEAKRWCLPSWIWTSAASARVLVNKNKTNLIGNVISYLIDCQTNRGGWIVRNDFDSQGAIPMLAPNDSAYIANNAFLTLYKRTKDEKYLNIVRKCADWIIETARPDGMVYTGYNMRDEKWDKNCVIVDVGFTGGLFARLAEYTREDRYLIFLKKFIERYIELFYIPEKQGFCTSINKDNKQQGGLFARGQAWALEGLIPAYKVLKYERIKQVIDKTVDNLLREQLRNGGWPYNLTRPLMGEDCKAVSVIAKDMMEWYKITKDERIKVSAQKALEWCCKHTAIEGEATGGIFSFCMEGAIVHNHYSSCAFVYASAYAIELSEMLKGCN